MRHLKAGRRLGRNASHRLAMFRNMTMALIRHERIITTVAKAKEARGFVEKLITLAKKNTPALGVSAFVLEASASALAVQGRRDPGRATRMNPKDADERHVIIKLFTEIAPLFAERQGGYTRILKRQERRLGDAGPTAGLIELVEQRVRASGPRRRSLAAAAPVVVAILPPVQCRRLTPPPPRRARRQTPPATEPTPPAAS